MHVAIITAGGAGMFCGSCMHDNTLAKALQDRGTDVSLIPTYTPIRVDEENQSTERVFLGGINVYLEHRFRAWRWLPRWMTRWLDHPRIINWATRRAVDNNAQNLGSLTVSMLDGESGPQCKQVDELAMFLGNELQPDVIVFSNALLAGALKRLKEEFSGPVFCILQGDDIFINDLTEPYRQQSIDRIFQRGQLFDGFFVHTEFYKHSMSRLLGFETSSIHCIPLGIDVASHSNPHANPATDLEETKSTALRIGYFARICPEKGLHQLVKAFRQIHQRYPHVTLSVGGYLGPRDHAYFQQVVEDAAALGDQFEYVGSPPDHAAKVVHFETWDIFSVPTEYKEPKGISILEALAHAIPVVQPAHGSFEEIIQKTDGGLLFEPGNIDDLAAKLEQLINDAELRKTLGQQGRQGVERHYSLEAMTEACHAVFEHALDKPNTISGP